MTDERLNELERLAGAATSGPWYAHNTDDWMFMSVYSVTTSPHEPDTQDMESMQTQGDIQNAHSEIIALTLYQAPRVVCHESNKWGENANFIAAARTAVPELLAEVRRLQESLHFLQTRYDSLNLAADQYCESRDRWRMERMAYHRAVALLEPATRDLVMKWAAEDIQRYTANEGSS